MAILFSKVTRGDYTLFINANLGGNHEKLKYSLMGGLEQ